MIFYDLIHLRQNQHASSYRDPDSIESPSPSKRLRSDKNFDLIGFNQISFGEFNFKQLLLKEDGDTFINIKAVINGEINYGFIDLKEHRSLFNKIKISSPEENSRKINDYILTISGFTSKKPFMHLGIDDIKDQEMIIKPNNQSVLKFDKLFDRIFYGLTIREKINDYRNRSAKLQKDPKSLIILDKVLKNGLAIKVFKNKISLKDIPEDLQFGEVKIASYAKKNLSEAIYSAAISDKEILVRFFLLQDEIISSKKLAKSIEFAGHNCNESMFKLLLSKHKSIKSKHLKVVINNLIKKGNQSMIDVFLAKLPSKKKCVISGLALFGYEDKVKAFLSAHSEYVLYAINSAIKGGHEILAKNLIDERPDLSSDDLTQLIEIAAQFNCKSLVRYLLKDNFYRIEMVIDGLNLGGTESMLLDLVKDVLTTEEVIISTEDLGKYVIKASQYGHESLVEYLLLGGREIFIEDLEKSVLVASQYGYESLIKFLLSNDRKISSKCLGKALVIASKYGYLRLVEFFLSKDVGISKSYLNKAIIIAHKNIFKSIFFILLDKLITVRIPVSIKKDIIDFKNSLIDPDSSWERLIGKLIVYGGDKDHLKIVIERLINETSFISTPKPDEKELLKSWYAHIKRTMRIIDSKIDPDPTKNIEEKKNLLTALESCGGGWQSHLEQMQQTLVDFPESTPVEIFIGKIIDDLVNRIAESINEDYSKILEIRPNVHDQNKIKFYLKDFLVEEVIDDKIAVFLMPKITVGFYFYNKFNLDLVIEEILSSIRTNPGFESKIRSYYTNELFKGCLSNHEIDSKIEKDRVDLKKELDELEKSKAVFDFLKPIISKAGSLEKQFEVLSYLTINNKNNFILFIKRMFEIDDHNLLFTDEQINILFEQKTNVIEMIRSLRKIKLLNGALFSDILTQTKDQLMQSFIDKIQIKIESYAVEDFELNHTEYETKQLLPSGINLILQKIGFII